MAVAQLLTGVVKDSHNEEAIQLASIEIVPARIGTVTDSAGFFSIDLTGYRADTLVVTYVGYDRMAIPIAGLADISSLVIKLERTISETVFVRKKVDRGLLLWKKVVRQKPLNDRYRYSNFGYELHNKIEIDLNRVNKEKIREIGLLKPFAFGLRNLLASFI